MSADFERARPKDLPKLCALYRAVIDRMRESGRARWDWERYPSEDALRADMDAGRLYCLREGGDPVAALALCDRMEDEYARLTWLYGVKPAALHRLAVRPDRYGDASLRQALDFALREAARLGHDSLRLDVFRDDAPMLALARSMMARAVGQLDGEDADDACLCFESPLTPQCPMLPVRMRPAFRYGEMTPWGGDGLQTMYRKPIPDPRTGESMEVSAIPGLESVTDAGEKLSDLLRMDARRLMGDASKTTFPLLLKLLCAKQPLSVQVHPDDAYAKANEGKLGKTEAWVILRAEPGARLLYGLRDGATIGQLRDKLEAGEDIEPMIQSVDARPGDVFYMPSGMVHAIGGGILLYEIQQSSDVTYRLWDFRRKDAEGRERPLHIRQSLDVIDPALKGQKTRLPEGGRNGVMRLLAVPAFTLDCASVNGELELAPHPEGMRIITALAGLLVSWEGDALELEAGESAVLPAACPPVTLMGVGQALLAGE